MLFTGHSECTVDSKLRLAVPAKYRNQWIADRDGTAWYCVPWPTGMLRLYTEKKFEELAGRIDQSLMPSEDEADLDADFFGLAERLELDAQGRLTIPRSHIELTEIGREVVVVGARNRLEVRDRESWLGGTESRFKRLSALSEKIDRKRSGESSPGS